MKKKLQYVIIFLTIFIFNINLVNADFSSDKVVKICGFEYMPERLPGFTSGIYGMLKILVPIILIVMGMLDFTKATMANKEDDMKKAQKKFITRLIAGVMVFFVMSIVQFVFKNIDNNSGSLASCMNCILNDRGCGTTSVMDITTSCDNRSLQTCTGTDKYGSTCIRVGGLCRSQCNTILDEDIATRENRCNARSYCTWYNGVCNNKKTPSYSIPKTSSSGVSGGGGSSGTTTTSEQQKIATYARNFATGNSKTNHPYVYGGNKLCTTKPYNASGCGVDCSSFVQNVYKNNGYSCLPRTAAQQAKALNAKTYSGNTKLKVGDLLFYKGNCGEEYCHVAMYTGSGEVVHASSKSTGVIVSKITYRTPVAYVSVIGNSKCKNSK